jgi:hypothetical protein
MRIANQRMMGFPLYFLFVVTFLSLRVPNPSEYNSAIYSSRTGRQFVRSILPAMICVYRQSFRNIESMFKSKCAVEHLLNMGVVGFREYFDVFSSP